MEAIEMRENDKNTATAKKAEGLQHKVIVWDGKKYIF